MEKQFWRQETGIIWSEKGDQNKRFFNNLAKEIIKRLQLNRIQHDASEQVEGINFIAEEVIKYFQEQFTQKDDGSNFELLNHIQKW